MDLFNPELMYELHAKKVSQVGAVKQYADHTVAEIKSVVGWDADVQINIVPLSYDDQQYSVSLTVTGVNDPVFVKKEGRHVLALMRKVRKLVHRQLRRRHQRNLVLKPKHFSKTAS